MLLYNLRVTLAPGLDLGILSINFLTLINLSEWGNPFKRFYRRPYSLLMKKSSWDWFANENLKSDREIVLEAVRNDGRALEYASEIFKSDRGIVLEAVMCNGISIEFAVDTFACVRITCCPQLLSLTSPQLVTFLTLLGRTF